MENQNHKWLVITICSGVIIAFLTLLFSLANKQADKTVNVDVSAQQPVSETPYEVPEANNVARNDNYFANTSPGQMKNDAIRDITILFNALANITYDKNKLDLIDEYCVVYDTFNNTKTSHFEGRGLSDCLLSSIGFRDCVKSYYMNKLDVPAGSISNKMITDKILNDIRLLVEKLEYNDGQWKFKNFFGEVDDRKIVLSHCAPANILTAKEIEEISKQYYDVEYVQTGKRVLNKRYPDRICIFRSDGKPDDGESFYYRQFAGYYNPMLGHWQFDISSFFRVAIMTKDQDTFLFQEHSEKIMKAPFVDFNDLYIE